MWQWGLVRVPSPLLNNTTLTLLAVYRTLSSATSSQFYQPELLYQNLSSVDLMSKIWTLRYALSLCRSPRAQAHFVCITGSSKWINKNHMNLWLQLRTKLRKLIMPLIVINKLGEDGRGRDHEFNIAIDDWTQSSKS